MINSVLLTFSDTLLAFRYVLLRLRVIPKAFNSHSSFFSFSFLLPFFDELAKFILNFYSNWCFKYVWPESELLISSHVL